MCLLLAYAPIQVILDAGKGLSALFMQPEAVKQVFRMALSLAETVAKVTGESRRNDAAIWFEDRNRMEQMAKQVLEAVNRVAQEEL